MGEMPESLTQMSEEQRKDAMARFEVIREYVEGRVSQVELASQYQVPVKTVQRWGEKPQEISGLKRYEND